MRMTRGVWVAIISFAILAVLGGITWAGQKLGGKPAPDSIFCTQEVKQCPDGSYVGRTGPKCEFVCANSDDTPQPLQITVETGIGKSVRALSINLVPLTVVEDSRCPVDVECVWAGTVRVKTSIHSALGDSEMILTLNEPVTTEAETITLVGVKPAARSQTTKIPQSEYLFMFEVKKR